MYAHEETMSELELSNTDLPKELQAQIRTWNNKKRFAKKDEALSNLENSSNDLANQIIEWFNEYEDEDDEDNDTPPSPPIQKTVETQPNIISNVKNEEIENGDEEPRSSWGLNTGNW
jgi:hypothetical protein